MMTSLTILLHLILLHTLSCSLEYFSPTTIHELSQIARQVGSKSIRAWILFLQLFSSVRSTSLYMFYVTLLTFPWKLVIFHDLLNLQSCHRSLRGLHSTWIDTEFSTNVQHHSCACPRSLRKSSLPVLFTILSWISLLHRSNLRTNAFTIARQLLSASIATYYVPSITDVVYVVLLLLDLSTAFDTVDHNLLLSRLESKFSIRGKALQWFISYLSRRFQFDCMYWPG